MLTNREVVKRINRWAKKPRARVPVCGHNESHGRLKAIILKDGGLGSEVVMSCTQCDFKEFAELPNTAYQKVA